MPNEDQDLNQEKKQEEIVPELTPVEQEARASGWVPKEEFDGDEHKWVDAGEFIRRGELFKKIDIQNKELKEVKKTLQLLAQQNAKEREKGYQQAIADLKAQKKEALIEGDADALIAIDEKLDLVKDEHRAFKDNAVREVHEATDEIHPELAAWTARNTWYNEHAHMRKFADEEGVKLARAGMKPSEVLKELEKLVREEFPKRFRNPNREKPGAVEGTSSKGTGAAKSSSYQPTEFERQVAKRFVKAGAFKTEEEYYKQLQG